MKRLLTSMLVAGAVVGGNASAAPHYEFLTPDSPSDLKAQALLATMTLEEKIGQMIQVDLGALQKKSPEDVTRRCLGSVLSGGDSDPADNSLKTWTDTYDELQSRALKTRLRIPLLYGVDAVHGHNNVLGAVIFPHSIGLGATRNPVLLERAGRATAEEVAASGIDWAFAPGVIVARDKRWGRTYESFAEEPKLVGELGAAYIRGLQSQRLSYGTAILACAKHFLGDGGTLNGKDQGDTVCDEATLRRLFLPPYAAAVRAGVGSIMISYSSWNGQKMHGNKYLMTDVLKGELGFRGFLISDWAAIDQLPGDYRSDIETAINAGLDMIMIPSAPPLTNNYVEFADTLLDLVRQGRVSQARIDDAVRRILRIKFEMGLFEHPYADRKLAAQFGSREHREVARECVRESLVLLKNENHTLPLSKNTNRIHVTGPGADDLGMQCGGWTIWWQGSTGPVTEGGTTILSAIKNTVLPGVTVTTSKDGSGGEGADAVVVVIGEKPYAEGIGDRTNLNLSATDLEVLRQAKASGAPVVLVLLSGRPLILGEALGLSDAVIAAWLPGTEGQGVADVLFGDHKPSGKLPMSWPARMEQVPINVGDENYQPLFPFGFGLGYSKN